MTFEILCLALMSLTTVGALIATLIRNGKYT
jgi:hypothetical protein